MFILPMRFPDRLKLARATHGPDECWLWPGGTTTSGYVQTRWKGGSIYLHRLAYQLEVGPIPEGHQVDHLCRVRHCFNPHHLEPVTPRENTLRGQSAAAVNARKTHCKHGHPFDEANTLVVKARSRWCRACQRARNHRRADLLAPNRRRNTSKYAHERPHREV